jgi:hypothetical protein
LLIGEQLHNACFLDRDALENRVFFTGLFFFTLVFMLWIVIVKS